MKLIDLVVDYHQQKQEDLADSLRGLVIFDKKGFDPKFVSRAKEITTEGKVLASVAAFQAKAILSDKKFLVQPSDVGRLTRLKGGTVRPLLKKLFENGLIFKTAEEGYFLTQDGLTELKEINKGGEKYVFRDDSNR